MANQPKNPIIDLVLSISSTLGIVTESLYIGDKGKIIQLYSQNKYSYRWLTKQPMKDMSSFFFFAIFVCSWCSVPLYERKDLSGW